MQTTLVALAVITVSYVLAYLIVRLLRSAPSARPAHGGRGGDAGTFLALVCSRVSRGPSRTGQG